MKDVFIDESWPTYRNRLHQRKPSECVSFWPRQTPDRTTRVKVRAVSEHNAKDGYANGAPVMVKLPWAEAPPQIYGQIGDRFETPEVLARTICISWMLQLQNYIIQLLVSRPPLWSSDHSSWLQIQRPGFDYRRYQIFWEVVGLESDSWVLGWKSSDSGLERREYGRRDPSRWSRGNLYPQKLALTSPTRGGRSVGIVRSRTQATEFSFQLLVSTTFGNAGTN
jgi:hypothetical protein